jgi:hypothetical protein
MFFPRNVLKKLSFIQNTTHREDAAEKVHIAPLPTDAAA